MKKLRNYAPVREDHLDIGFLQDEIGIFSGEDHRDETIHIRWASMRSDTILQEFTKILIFVQDEGGLSDESIYMYRRMHRLLSCLKLREKDSLYMEVLLVVKKYIDGVKRFLSKHLLEGGATYRQLFEGVFIAIIHETGSIGWIH